MNGDYIDEYLAQLRAALSTPPARTAEIVAEAEDHLRESAAARQADGLGAAAAQRAAIAAFGPVKQVSRAHRPTAADYAAASAMRAWPLLGGCLVLTALLGGVDVWREVVEFGGVMVPATLHDGRTLFNPQGTADPAQLAATLGGCALAGLLVLAGSLAVRRRWRRSVAALAPLPPGLFPLAAGIALLVLATAVERAPGYRWVWLPRVQGIFELIVGSREATALLGVCCVLGALVSLAAAAVRPRPPVPVRPGAGPGWARADKTLLAGEARGAAVAAFGPARPVRARRIPVSAYAAQGAQDAGQWLGSYLLLAALIGGVLLYAERYDLSGARDNLARWEAVCAGCGLAGSLLFAGVQVLRRRRGWTGGAPLRLPRWLSLPVITVWLLLVAVAEYRIFSGNVMGNLDATEQARPAMRGIYWLVLGAQFAAVLIALGSVVRGVAFLVRWLRAGQSAAAQGYPPDNADLAPVR